MEETLFQSVADRDHDALVNLYASNAQEAVESYLHLQRRWRRSVQGANDHGAPVFISFWFNYWYLTHGSER